MRSSKRSYLYPYILIYVTTIFAFSSSPCFAQTPTLSSGERDSIVSKTLDLINGYYKLLFAVSRAPSTNEGIFSALQRLRVEFKPQLTKNILFHLIYDNELLFHDFGSTAGFSLIRQNDQRKLAFFDADDVFVDEGHVYGRHLFYRAYFKFESPHSRWTLGKQNLDWGRLRFYSPLDLFNQPFPSSIEADERVGFDALNIELFSNDFSGVNLLYGPGRNENATSYGLRLHKKFGTYDTSLIWAKHEDERAGGFGFDGYVGEAGLRGEFTYTRRHTEYYARAAIGGDYNFPGDYYFACEYFYNGAANGDFATFSSSLKESRKRLSLRQHLISLFLSHEVTPLLKLSGLCIIDPEGKSVFLNPELSYNVVENLDINAGVQLFSERKGSEFQDYNNVFYIESKLFF